MRSQKAPKPALKVGADSEEFDVEVVVPVTIRQTRRERCVALALQVATTIAAVTIAQVLIIPMFG